MTKDELKKEAEEYAEVSTNEYKDCLVDIDDKSVLKEAIAEAYLASAEPREKRIAELEANSEIQKNLYRTAFKKIDKLEKENAELKADNDARKFAMAMSEKVEKQLREENAELKKNYEDSLVAYGVLKNKVELLSQPSPLESMQDVLITTQKVAYEKQKEQLTKAKELLNEFMKYEINEYDGSLEIHFEELKKQAEQFLSEVEK